MKKKRWNADFDKKVNNIINPLYVIFLFVSTIAFLILFLMFKMKNAWIVWPIAAIVYASITLIIYFSEKIKFNRFQRY